MLDDRNLPQLAFGVPRYLKAKLFVGEDFDESDGLRPRGKDEMEIDLARLRERVTAVDESAKNVPILIVREIVCHSRWFAQPLLMPGYRQGSLYGA